MTKAEEFLELGKKERNSYRAAKIFSAVIRLEPNNANFYFRRGCISAPAEAIEDCTRAIKLDLNNSVSYYLRGNYWKNLGEDEKAQADLKKYKKLHRIDKLKDEIKIVQ